MQWVLLCTLPGFLALVWFFGWGVFINVAFATLLAVSAEALILLMRKKPIGLYLKDYSAVVTAVLLALALPPLAPWWVTTVAVLAAIVVAKHLYGGLGQNPFNPAMVGYALVLVSFPVAMTTLWTTPVPLLGAENLDSLGFLKTLQVIFLGANDLIDGYTMATPLDVYKHEISIATAEELTQKAVFGSHIAVGWEWVNLGFLAGGLVLLWRKIISWHIPAGFFAGLAVCSLVFGWDEDRYTPLHLHLFAGATMLGAFFIATDPVSAATSKLGKIYYGAGIGVLLYIIRTWGGYPDAVAFAVLLMNFAAPFLDYYTRPRTYGHRSARRGIK